MTITLNASSNTEACTHDKLSYKIAHIYFPSCPSFFMPFRPARDALITNWSKPCCYVTLQRMSNAKPKIAASSAYREHLKLAAFGNTRFRIPLCAAASMILWSGSIARMNGNGDKGSPCLSPCTCLILWVGSPLIKILEVAVPRSIAIQSLHLCWSPKPLVLQVGRPSQ